MSGPLYGCIGAGGTKFVLGVARDHRSFLETSRISSSAAIPLTRTSWVCAGFTATVWKDWRVARPLKPAGKPVSLDCRRIVMSGGVLATPALLTRICANANMLGGGYFGDVDCKDIVVAPMLGDRSGLLGGLALAQGVAS